MDLGYPPTVYNRRLMGHANAAAMQVYLTWWDETMTVEQVSQPGYYA